MKTKKLWVSRDKKRRLGDGSIFIWRDMPKNLSGTYVNDDEIDPEASYIANLPIRSFIEMYGFTPKSGTCKHYNFPCGITEVGKERKPGEAVEMYRG